MTWDGGLSIVIVAGNLFRRMMMEFKSLDKAIKELDQLVVRMVIREFAILLRLYIRARAFKGLKRIRLEIQAQCKLARLSDSARLILETALRCKN